MTIVANHPKMATMTLIRFAPTVAKRFDHLTWITPQHARMKFKLALLLAATAFTLQLHAQPYYLAGEFQSPQWVNNANQMTAGPSGRYDYTITGQTPGAYAQMKVTDGTWNNTWPGNNLVVQYDSTGSATIHFYPGSFTDGWLPLANRLGWEDPGSMSWGVAGDPNGYDGTQLILASIGSGMYSNSMVVASAASFGFQFQSPAGHWDDIHFGSDFGNGSANGSYTTTNSPQTVPITLDLPKGRYLVGSLAPNPVTNTVVFAVDMTFQTQVGNFHGGSIVYVAGNFNNWPGPGTTGLVMTNSGANTNIYYATNQFIGLPNALASEFKFNQNDASAPNGGWETSNNRQLTLLPTNGTIILPAVYFSEVSPADILTAPMAVAFSVDMTGAVGTDSHSFDPNSDGLYVNGIFANWYAWAGGINPASAPPGYQLFQQGSSMIFTNTVSFPAGTPVYFEYKYGMDPFNTYGGPNDDEAGFAQNHKRAVRITKTGAYTLPADKFGTQYQEPFFAAGNAGGANLRIGARSGATVPVSWLGRPGAHLQVNTSLGGSWTDLTETDGTNWVSGVTSTNGFVSVTNWPATGNAFFRLVKP